MKSETLMLFVVAVETYQLDIVGIQTNRNIIDIVFRQFLDVVCDDIVPSDNRLTTIGADDIAIIVISFVDQPIAERLPLF
jgi:hypothetical protein